MQSTENDTDDSLRTPMYKTEPSSPTTDRVRHVTGRVVVESVHPAQAQRICEALVRNYAVREESRATP